MELRSSRSRSKTPFIQTSVEEEAGEDQIKGTSFRTTRSTTKVTSYNFLTNNNRSSTPQSTMKTRNSKSEKVTRKTRYKTSDYSSEEGEVSESAQNSTNHFINDSRRSESRSTGSVSAIDYYRAAGDYWNKYPKTDYTYSLYSKDRTEIAPGVLAMPNMSRRSLHNADYANDFLRSHKETNTNLDEFVTTPHNYRTTTEEITNIKQRNLFSNNDYNKRYQYTAYTKDVTTRSFYLKIWDSFVTSITWIAALFYYIFQVQSSTCIWFAKILHRIATRVMLWDSWLLRSVRTRNKVTSLLALCLIPLLLFGGWWLISQIGPLYYNKYWSNYSTSSLHGEITPTVVINSIDETPSESNANNISPNVQTSNNYKLTNDDHSTQTLRQQQQIIDSLKIEIDKIRLELLQLEQSSHQDISDAITRLRAEYTQKISNLNYKLNRCCRSTAIPIESHVTQILKEFFQAPQELHNYKDISQWIRTTFVAKQDLEVHLANITRHVHSDFDLLIENNREMIMNDIMSKVTSEFNRRVDQMQNSYNKRDVNIESMTDAYIKGIVKDTLAIYDADKTGLVDYALESAGGQVLNTKCTESYNAGTAAFSILGIQFPYSTNTPRTAITPGASPGECWAFQNFPGFLVIKLTARVQIEAFSLEHISKALSPNGKIDSAPKEFHVYGLQNEKDLEPILLGEYFYDEDGSTIQYFTVGVPGLVFHVVELKIISNHGNLKYTCLYRFRVHGKLALET